MNRAFLAFSFVLVLLCTCSRASGACFRRGKEVMEFSDRVREGLIANSIRFYDQAEPIAPLNPVNDTPPFFNLNYDVILLVFEYLEFCDIMNLCRAFKYFGEVKGHSSTRRLAIFNKHYVFEYFWLNIAMHKVISDNFPSDITLESPQIHDYVELMILKYIINDYSLEIKKQAPQYVYFAILSFIYGTVYGEDAVIPLDLKRWQIDFALKIQEYDFPVTYAYLMNFNQPFDYEENFSKYKTLIIFLAQKPDLQARLAFVAQFNNIFESIFGPDFALILTTNFDDTTKLTRHDAQMLLNELSRTSVYSEKLLNRIETSVKLSELKLQFQRFFFRKRNHWVTGTLTYMLSRDLKHPFVLQKAKWFWNFDPVSVFYVLKYLRIPFLVSWDIATQIVRSCPLEYERKEFIFKDILESGSRTPFSELPLLEYPKLVNFFDGHFIRGSSTDRKLVDESKMDIAFATQCPRNNPLSAIFLLDCVLERYVTRCRGRFNLNVKYRFDWNFSLRRNCGLLTSEFLTRARGQTLTFREMVKLLDNPTISAAFGLLTDADFEESEEAKQAYPVMSLTDYFKDPNLLDFEYKCKQSLDRLCNRI